MERRFYFDSSYSIRRPKIKFEESHEERQFSYYLNEFGKNKKLPPGLELPALVALSYYPELREVEIEFVIKGSKHISSAKPKPFSIIKQGEKRTYQVIISDDIKEELKPILLRNLTFNCQIGVLGHELGHISDYIEKNSLEVVLDGLSYGIDSEKKKMEKKTDAITIKHKLGYQILEYAQLIEKLKVKFPNEEYYSTYTNYYMSVGEIKAMIKEMPVYQGSL
jgi:hypothetical protein